jgi:predicted secreted protein
MAASNGRAVIIEIGAESLADELRTKTITFNGELVDVTTDGDDGWSTMLDGIFNTQNVTIALDGVLKADTLSDMAFTGAQETMTITVGDLFTLDGDFQFTAGFQIGAPYNGETTFSGTLQSTGTIVKAPVA